MRLRHGPQYQLTSRWTSTATQAGPLRQGDPTVITYSFVPDGTWIPSGYGEPAGPSNLFATLGAIFGSAQAWQVHFHLTLARWSPVSGVTFRHEPNDDGASLPNAPGQLGVRGDVRISGHFIDGQSGANVLAYNYYPWAGGDMVLDTANTVLWSNAAVNYVGLRNVIAHESGHGLGLLHVCPLDQTKLMEPILAGGFDGAQHDDILGVLRHYGDRLEPNDAPTTATDLGTIELGAGRRTVDLCCDGSADVDCYRIAVPAASRVTVTVTPVGRSYLEGPQTSGCTGVRTVDSRIANDLAFEVLAANGSTVLIRADTQPAGVPERAVVAVPAGACFVRVMPGSVDTVQMYELEIATTGAERIIWSLDATGAYDAFGWMSAGAGDVNRDGFDDFLVASPYAASNTGRVDLFSGVDASVIRSFYPPPGADMFGRGLTIVGDIDRDGIAEVLIGAPSSGQPDRGFGRAFLYSGATGSLVRRHEGDAAYQYTGIACAALADIDGDLVPDYILGGSGKVRVCSGRTGAVLHAFTGPAFFGYAVAGVGDLDNDGIADVLVGSHGDSTRGSNAGAAFAFSGRTGTVIQSWYGATNERLGIAILAIRDFDGDRVDDVVVGADAANDQMGFVRFLSGRSGQTLRQINGDAPGDHLGTSIAVVGDADEDGVADLVIGATRNAIAATAPGYAALYSMRTGIRLAQVFSDQLRDSFGWSVSNPGDVDGDGQGDFLAGTYRRQTGMARVYSPRGLVAAVRVFGVGCGGGGSPPTIASTVPRLGQAATLSVAGTPRAFAAVLASTPTPGLLVQGCVLHVDASRMFSLAGSVLDAAGSASMSVPVPSSSLLAGLRLVLQSVVFPGNGALGTDLSPGVIWTLR